MAKKTTKTQLLGNEEVLKYVATTNASRITKNEAIEKPYEHTIRRTTFKNCHFTGDITRIEFVSCRFIDCHFENVWGFFFMLQKCVVKNCRVDRSRFSHLELFWFDVLFENCQFYLVQFDEAGFIHTHFTNCYFGNVSLQDFNPIENVSFTDCYFYYSQFQDMIFHSDEDAQDFREEFPDITMEKCVLDGCHFNSVDLRNSTISNSQLFKSGFLNCQLSAKTLSPETKDDSQNYASIDLQTIVKSAPISRIVLAKYFAITDPNVQATLKTITTKMKFQSVFISFSFKDKLFAQALYDGLTARGVPVFYWEHDAPGGRTLRDIMSTNVQRFERLVFIASEYSLKSKPCQFEISEARKKQEATWDDILYPIHIDDYLFEVTKDRIRPIHMADEYWENIEELKRVNSRDLTFYRDGVGDKELFDQQLDKIVADLAFVLPTGDS